jgi:TetR/AcrR family transcriptional regulator, mexJK operon transcriptional repressor
MVTSTLEPAPFRRGPGGRPTRQEAERRHGVLLDNAARLFLDHGFDAVSIDLIAKRAAVAKRFVYARYRDKSELFVAAVEHLLAGRLELLQAFQPAHRNAEAGLIAFGRTLVDIALDPEAIALLRLFIATAPRFPELTTAFIARNRHRSMDEIVRVLAHYAERGAIRLAAPQLMAEQFFIAVVGIPQRAALLGFREPSDAEQQRLRAAVRLFLNGCRA